MKKVEVRINIESKPENIISAFIDPAKLKEWWQVEKTLIDAKPGGLYILNWGTTENGIGYVSSGVVKEYSKNSTLKIDNFVYMNPGKPLLGPMTLTIRVTEMQNYTEVYLCQDGYQEGAEWDWYYNAVKHAWPEVMENLKNYLER